MATTVTGSLGRVVNANGRRQVAREVANYGAAGRSLPPPSKLRDLGCRLNSLLAMDQGELKAWNHTGNDALLRNVIVSLLSH
jgi:hypothetical protein